MHSVLVAVQSLSHFQLFATPWIAACQAPLSSAISWILLKFMSIESVMLSNRFILFLKFFLLYNIVLVLPYINMNPPRVYTCSAS